MTDKKTETSWDSVATWYDAHVEKKENTYHRQVILPNLLRILPPKTGMQLLDVACGQGFFSREYAKHGVHVIGTDISQELIEYARSRSPKELVFHTAPAHRLAFARSHEFNAALMILAAQNIENIAGVFAEMRRVLIPDGKLILVMNHPAFRIPQHSSWGWDARAGVQYRRIDRYLSGKKISILMHPGKKESPTTVTYHRSLQDISKALTRNGFFISGIEEWISNRRSQRGPRQKAEDAIRKEIPLFLMLEAHARPKAA